MGGQKQSFATRTTAKVCHVYDSPEVTYSPLFLFKEAKRENAEAKRGLDTLLESLLPLMLVLNGGHLPGTFEMDDGGECRETERATGRNLSVIPLVPFSLLRYKCTFPLVCIICLPCPLVSLKTRGRWK